MRLLPAYRALMIFMLGLAMPVFAQEEGLARDFEKLSAKERARIAKEEQEAARVDVAFQAAMTQAEDLFRQVKYEESMTKFKEARSMRPYNVYPKVKIQDLQALIAKRDAAISAVAPAPDPAVAPGTGETVVGTKPVSVASNKLVFSEPVRERTVEVVRSHEPRAITGPAKVLPPKSEAPVSVKHTVASRPAVAPVLIEGQRVYKEGRSVVVENTLGQEGHLVTYRKVSHPWGEVNYFRDGSPISARAHQQAMDGR